jgi:C-terminal processing protease CtpA/Prc
MSAIKQLISFLICFALKFCTAQTSAVLSPDDQLFFEKLIWRFESSSIERDKIDWKEFRRQVLEKALVSKDSAIILALKLNNNPHSYFKFHDRELWAGRDSLRKKAPSRSTNCPELSIRDEMKDFGYVVVKGVKTNPNSKDETQQQGESYIKNLIGKIIEEDQRDLKGWIIDLRFNAGGNMWPMVVALTPFYSDGILGYFFNAKDTSIYTKGDNQIWLGTSSQTLRFLSEPITYQLKNNNLKVAVLVSGWTMSSGEALAISMKSQKNVRIFGTKTYGFSTANQPLKIEDDAYLILTTSVDADSKKVVYWDGIEPDTKATCETLIEELEKWFEETKDENTSK